MIGIAAVLLMSPCAESEAGYTPACTESGIPVRWEAGFFQSHPHVDVVFHDNSVEQLPLEEVMGATARAFRAWSPRICEEPDAEDPDDRFVLSEVEFGFDFDEPLQTSDEANLIRVVGPDEPDAWPADTHTIAMTFVQHDPDTGAIEDADVFVNDRDFDFALHPGSEAPDLYSVMLHEAGHVLGLDHSSVREATMHEQATTVCRIDDAGTLHAGDVAGFCFLYGPLADDVIQAARDAAAAAEGRLDCQAASGPSSPAPLLLLLLGLALLRRRTRRSHRPGRGRRRCEDPKFVLEPNRARGGSVGQACGWFQGLRPSGPVRLSAWRRRRGGRGGPCAGTP